MLQLLKEIILDAQQGIWFTGTQRSLGVIPVEKKATIIIGVRRCGKTILLNQVVSRLISEGVSKDNFLYINFFDDRLAQLKTFGLDKVLEAFFLIYPEKKLHDKIYCFFDEIQVVTGWESFIDRILRTENCEVYITGCLQKCFQKRLVLK